MEDYIAKKGDSGRTTDAGGNMRRKQVRFWFEVWKTTLYTFVSSSVLHNLLWDRLTQSQHVPTLFPWAIYSLPFFSATPFSWTFWTLKNSNSRRRHYIKKPFKYPSNPVQPLWYFLGTNQVTVINNIYIYIFPLLLVPLDWHSRGISPFRELHISENWHN